MFLSRTGTHQALLLVGALALAGGLYALPKGIVKPKESKAELNQDAARTATRDGGGIATNGSKTDASSGPRPAETATVGPANPATGGTAAAPHTQADANLRRELNGLLAQYKVAPAASRSAVATKLAASYTTAQRFDSAGYYLATVAQAKPSEKAWQQAADSYFQAFAFASSAERKKMLGTEARELYDKVLAANPKNLDAKANMGMTFVRGSDNPVKGITLLREVLEQDPRHEKTLYYLGELAIESNQLDKAAERFAQLVKVNPNNVEGQFYLGVTLARTNRAAEAKAAFLKAKSLSNDPALAASVDEELTKLP